MALTIEGGVTTVTEIVFATVPPSPLLLEGSLFPSARSLVVAGVPTGAVQFPFPPRTTDSGGAAAADPESWE